MNTALMVLPVFINGNMFSYIQRVPRILAFVSARTVASNHALACTCQPKHKPKQFSRSCLIFLISMNEESSQQTKHAKKSSSY
jgi:hypothetical protein